ncbi:hypothetical protein EV126DRAFT_484684, partial [Verticillium dahliae]
SDADSHRPSLATEPSVSVRVGPLTESAKVKGAMPSFATAGSASLRIGGRTRMDWQEKLILIIDEQARAALKLENGARYTAVEAILDKTHPGHHVDTITVMHFGPPARLLLASETTNGFCFGQRKRSWQEHNVTRRGLPYAAAFACTDYKVQGRTLERVVLELRGTRTTNIDGYGIMLLSEARERDFTGDTVPEDMIDAERRLERLSEETIRDAEEAGLDTD